MSTFFAVDLGNTRAKVGIADADGLRDVLTIPVGSLAELAESFALIGNQASAGSAPVAVSSVNPTALEDLRRLAKQFTSGAVLTAGADFPIPIEVGVKEPKKVGTDRLLAALAAYHNSLRACIVLDFGTATTIDAVSAEGHFLGGAIVPGVDLMAKSLASGTAALPDVEVKKTADVIGRDTESAIAGGIYFGYVGLIDALINRFRAALACEVAVWATGGALSAVGDDLGGVDNVEPNLVLEGLAIAYRESSKQ